MAKVGRKSSFNEKLQSTITALIAKGKTEEQIAEIVGVSKKTLVNWKGKHPEFLHAVRDARQIADELVEASLFSRAVGYTHKETKVFCDKGEIVTHEVEKQYPPEFNAMQFWLRNRQPGVWKEKNEGDVHVSTAVTVADLTDEQLDAKIAEAIERVKKREL